MAYSISDLNPVSHWTCDETTGVRYDSNTTNSNDLTDNNTVGYTTGLRNNACDFESTQLEYFSITDAEQTGLDLTATFSFSYWVKIESDTDALIIGKDNGTENYGYNAMVSCSTQNDAVCLYDSTEQPSQIDGNITNGTWYHIAQVKNGSSYLLYVNNTYMGSTPIGDVTNSNATFMIGRTQIYNSNYFDGLLDEITIFNYALSADDVNTIFNAGIPLPYNETGGPTTTATTTIATTTTNMTDTNFMLAVIVFFLALMTMGLVFSTMRKQ